MKSLPALLMLASLATPAFSVTDDATPAATPLTEELATPDRWLVVVCGLPGDDEHRERLTNAVVKIAASAGNVLSVQPERLRMLVGDETMQQACSSEEATQSDIGVSDRESIRATLQSVADEAKAEDEIWVMMLGHASYYDGRSQFNVQGPDVDQTEFASWMKPLAPRRQVVWLTMPVSGFWIRPLAGDGKVIISATEADQEFTGTEMPYALADLLAAEGEYETLRDVDADGSGSLLDLYLAVNLEIQQRFKSVERLQTEHAQLDDNGDGRGSEVQSRYLPLEKDEASEEVDAEPTPQPIAFIITESSDGFRSRQIPIKLPTESRSTNEASE